MHCVRVTRKRHLSKQEEESEEEAEKFPNVSVRKERKPAVQTQTPGPRFSSADVNAAYRYK